MERNFALEYRQRKQREDQVNEIARDLEEGRPVTMPDDTLTAVANELSLFATGKLDEGSEAFFREALQVALERTRTALAEQARPEPVNERLLSALKDIRDATARRQLPLTDQIWRAADSAITEATNRMGPGDD